MLNNLLGPLHGAAAPQAAEKPCVNVRRTDDLASSKSPRQSFPIRRWENKLKSVFFGDMSIEKNTSQPASVESGRPLTRFCAQRAASPRKNACIFEKRVELFRHALGPLHGAAAPLVLAQWRTFSLLLTPLSGLPAGGTRSAGPNFSAMRNWGKNRQRRGLSPPLESTPRYWVSLRPPLFGPWPGGVTSMA